MLKTKKMLKTKTLTALLSIAALGITSGIAAADVLTRDQISSKIIGKTLKSSKMGMPVTILYKKDGSISVKMPLMSVSGSWEFNGNRLCMKMKRGPGKGKKCVTIEQTGDNRFRNSEGFELTVQK